MKLLTVTPLTHGHGGHSRHKEMIRALLRDGHEVVVVAPASSDTSSIAGVEHWRSVPPAWVQRSFLSHVVEALATMLRHRRLLREVDRVFVIYPHSLLAVLLVRACNGRRFPVVFLQRSDITTHLWFERSWVAGRLKRLALALRISLLEVIERWTLPRAALIVAQTEPLAARLAHDMPHLAPIAVLPNNCRPSWTRGSGSETDLLPGHLRSSVVIGFVGNCFYRAKGMDLLAEAFRIVVATHAIKLVVIGDGPGLGQFQEDLADAGIARHVCCLGRLANAWHAMRDLDLLVVPSRLDNCPNVVLEALAADVPIVATRIDAHEYLLGSDAPQLAPCEPYAIAARIERILSDSTFRSQVLAHQATRRARFDFDWQARVADLITTPLPRHDGSRVDGP